MTNAADAAENVEQESKQVPEDALQEFATPRERSFWLAVGASLLIGIVLVAFGLIDRGRGMNNAAPDFTLTSYNGTTYRLSDLRGKVVVINFWATTCQPCRLESPSLQALWALDKDSPVVFLGIDQKDKPEDAQTFLKDTGVMYPTGLDNGIVAAYGIQGLPTTIVVDRNGNVANRTLASIEPDTLQALIQSLVKSPESTQNNIQGTQDQPG